MKKLSKTVLWLSAAIIMFSACSKKDDPENSTGGKATIDNLALSPTSGLTYGDVVSLTGTLSDDVGLTTYTITVSNASGNIYEKTQMLTGKSFNLNESVVIPLYPNAVAGDLTLSLTVKNSGGQLTSQDLSLKNVQVPTFNKLYIVINGTIHEMSKNGNDFSYEDFVPASAKGRIYANANQTGLYWGWDNNSTIAVQGTNDITFGKDEEAYFKISFNSGSFVLTIGDTEDWQPLTGNDLYILGTISGNWRDGASNGHPNGITVEQNKMKMTATTLGGRKRWTWTPPAPPEIPSDYPGCEEFTMWGYTIAGKFRLKKAGQEQYIVYNAGQITTSAANSLDNNFILSANGSYPSQSEDGIGGFNITVMADENGNIISVSAADATQKKSVEYQNGAVLINGVTVTPSVSFAGNSLNLVPDNYFVYQGTIDLTNGQSVTGDIINLATTYCDPDVFSGSGNSTWKVVAPTSTYYVRIDALSGLAYVRDQIGYPNAIYMDGWCWQKDPTDTRTNWNTGTELTLYRQGTTNVYSASCYVQPWGGDIKFFAIPSTTDNLFPVGLISGLYFDLSAGQALTSNKDGGLMLPVPASPGAFYKVSVDLKSGMTLKTLDDGITIVGVPAGANFTVSFTPL